MHADVVQDGLGETGPARRTPNILLPASAGSLEALHCIRRRSGRLDRNAVRTGCEAAGTHRGRSSIATIQQCSTEPQAVQIRI